MTPEETKRFRELSRLAKKNSWSPYFKPIAPMGPQKPSKTVSMRQENTIAVVYSNTLEITPEMLSRVRGTLFVKAIGGECGICDEIQLIDEITVTDPNPSYANQMKDYNRQLKNMRSNDHKTNVALWKEWCDLTKIHRKEQDIEKARKLLEKNGML